ncbi:hypothetical protein CEXT_811371 [Caerostris extrusa]|uniref:Uncharacterized protein n=1 Tax=Caerostris extrusa TaxID=172846 RepID=A0AAV4SNJ9_CAEEX|nr:hypothetical protein CEXT_811371 [Caerostris extrusa]
MYKALELSFHVEPRLASSGYAPVPESTVKFGKSWIDQPGNFLVLTNVRRSARHLFESEEACRDPFRIAGTTTTTVGPTVTQRFESRFDRAFSDGSALTTSPTASTPRGEFVDIEILKGVGHTRRKPNNSFNYGSALYGNGTGGRADRRVAKTGWEIFSPGKNRGKSEGDGKRIAFRETPGPGRSGPQNDREPILREIHPLSTKQSETRR